MSAKDEKPTLLVEQLRQLSAELEGHDDSHEQIDPGAVLCLQAADLMDNMRKRVAWSYIQWCLTCPTTDKTEVLLSFEDWCDRIDALMDKVEKREQI